MTPRESFLRVALLSLALLLPSSVCLPQFDRTYGSSLNDMAYAIIYTPASKYVVAGYTTLASYPNRYYPYAIQLNTTGDVEWSWTSPCGSLNYFHPLGLTLASDGNVVLTSFRHYGCSDTGTFVPLVTKLSVATGLHVWEMVIVSTAENVSGRSVFAVAAGLYLVAGSKGFVAKLTENYGMVWASAVGQNADVDCAFNSIVAISAEKFAAVGPVLKGGLSYCRVALGDISVANVTSYLDVGGLYNVTCYQVVVASDGNLLVAAEEDRSAFGLTVAIYVLKFSPTLAVMWGKETQDYYDRYARSIQEMTNGKIVVAGYFGTLTSSYYQIFVITLTSTGDYLGSQTHQYSTYQEAHSVCVTSDGTIAAAGFTLSPYSAGYYDFYVFTDKCGTQAYPKSDGTCGYCSVVGCVLCNSASGCDKCYFGIGAHTSNLGVTYCYSPCPNGYYAAGGKCQPCLDGCKKCTNSYICEVCNAGLYRLRKELAALETDQCVASCADLGYTDLDGYCTSTTGGCFASCETCGTKTYDCQGCTFGYYLAAETSASVHDCKPCMQNCLECSGTAKCDQCQSGYYLVTKSDTLEECVKLCDLGYYKDSYLEECATCVDHCRWCTGRNFCAECDDGYYLYTDLANTVCNACVENCKVCTNGTTCLECISGYIRTPGTGTISDSCSSSCGTHYYHNSTSGECKSCDFRCLKCTGPTVAECTECDPGAVGVVKSSETGLCVCDLGYLTNSSSCDPCPDSPFCRECDLVEGCTSCAYGLKYNLNEKNCSCPKGEFKDYAAGRCGDCSPVCGECAGPTNAECVAGKCAAGAYPLFDLPTTCLYGCDGGFVLYHIDSASLTCKELVCDPSCGQCIGTEPTDCVTCADPTKVQYNGTCSSSACPSGYFASSIRICTPCGQNCSLCSSAIGCTECSVPALLQSGECVSACADGYFSSSDQLCRPCKPPCTECAGTDSLCTRCSSGLYLDPSSHTCLALASKPPHTYTAGDNSTFFPCSSECAECFGPGYDECVGCELGYAEIRPNVCVKIECQDGFYLSAETGVCKECNVRCKICSGGGIGDCTWCQEGYVLEGSLCKSCEEIHAGLKADPNDPAKCVAVCGDGIKFASEECDDGNTLDGDGCSADCRVEKGFACDSSGNTCYSTQPPVPMLRVTRGNGRVVLSFTQPIQFSSGDIMLSSIQPSLVSASKTCTLIWTPIAPSVKLGTVSQIEANTEIRCSISGKTEKIRLVFTDPTLFRSQDDVALGAYEVSAKLYRSRWMGTSEQQAVDALGTAVKSASILLFALSMAQYLLQSVALGSFWAFVNMLQILMYTPVMNAYVPEGLLQFMTNYLSVSQMQLPFSVDILPDSWTGSLKSQLLNVNLQDFGLSSASFLYNFCDQFVTWILLFLLYCVLVILDRLRPENRFQFIGRWKQDYTYNTVIRALIETFLDLTFYPALDLSMHSAANAVRFSSCLASSLALMLCFAFLVVCSLLTSLPTGEYEATEFKQGCSTITEEFRENEGPFVRGYYCVFIVRRAVFVVLLVFVDGSSVAQIVLTVLLDLGMLVYVSVFRPYKSHFDNCINIYNESVILFTHGSLLFLLDGEQSDLRLATGLGWTCIVLILASAIFVWGSMLFPWVGAAVGYLCPQGRPRTESATEAKGLASPAPGHGENGEKLEDVSVEPLGKLPKKKKRMNRRRGKGRRKHKKRPEQKRVASEEGVKAPSV